MPVVADVAAAEIATVRKRPQTQQPKLQRLPKRRYWQFRSK
jgi:hypothetical protein